LLGADDLREPALNGMASPAAGRAILSGNGAQDDTQFASADFSVRLSDPAAILH
jgi:hypothetical protein